MPADDRLGLDQYEGLAPFGPEAKEGHPQELIPSPKRDPPWLVPLENGQLVAESQDFDLERGTCTYRGGQPGEQRYQQVTHDR
jgi:hypothetical protein